MNYNDALREWGARRLESRHDVTILRPSVDVEFEFNEGFFCCGGTDPTCGCSFAEPPSSDVAINGVDTKGRTLSSHIDTAEFNFFSILREIVQAGDGEVTA